MPSDQTQPINVAVIGLGAIGTEHLEIYASHPLVDVVAVVDANSSHAAAVARKHGCAAFGSTAELLESDRQFSAASLCTPDEAHFADASRLMEAGKDLLLEKPIATDVDEACELVRSAESTDLIVMPGHTLRFEPRYHHAAQVFAGGSIGELVHGYMRRNNRVEVAERAGGRVPVSWFLGIHDIDALLWITGLRVEKVQAMETRARDMSGRQAVAIVANLRLSNGNVVQIESAWGLTQASPTDLDSVLRLVGSKGALSIDTFASGMTVWDEQFSYPMTAGGSMYNRTGGALSDEIGVFVSCCLTREPSPVTMRQALSAVRVIAAINESIATGNTIAVDHD